MSRARRHARTFRSRAGSARLTVGIALGLVLLLGGAAYGAYRYDAETSNRLLPGVTIDGVDVGEMTRADAIAAVRGSVAGPLERELEVRADGRTWHVTPAELGTNALVRRAVNEALAVSDRYTWPFRVFYRLANQEVDAAFDIEFRHSEKGIERFVAGIARQVEVDPTNAAVSFEGGELVLQRPEHGLELRVNSSVEALSEAMLGTRETVRLGVREIEPKVTSDDLGYTIVVRLSELKLYLYEGARLDRTYPIAAGQPQYPTPPGEWTIIDKAVNPTWTNPAPDGWGAGMPAVIPGGPGNPLGTRALYLNAPGIRIHGTSDIGSIGTLASHGCVRMAMPDVEELYDIIPIGTQVIITQ